MYWRTAAKNGPMREFAGIMGLIDVFSSMRFALTMTDG